MTLSLRHLFRGLTGRPAARPPARPARLQVEQLEERAVPTALVNIANYQFALSLDGGTQPGALFVQHENYKTGKIDGYVEYRLNVLNPVTGLLTPPKKGNTADGLQFGTVLPKGRFHAYHLTFTGTVGNYMNDVNSPLRAMTGPLTEYIPVGRFGTNVVTSQENSVGQAIPT